MKKIFTALIALMFVSSAYAGPWSDLADQVDANTTAIANIPAGQDGTDGTDGTNGANGTDGTNGNDGADGVAGTNGTNGTDGIDGQDFDPSFTNSGIASAMALGGIMQAPAGKNGFSLGVGNYEGETAGALGWAITSDNGAHAFKVGTTISEHDKGVMMGYGYFY